MKILLTAFRPYRSAPEVNRTETLVKEIQKEWSFPECELLTLALPVDWESAEWIIEEALATFRPDIVLSLGYITSYEKITVETTYLNSAEGKDNRGKIRLGEVVKPGGPILYGSTINIDRLSGELLDKNLEILVNRMICGKYLCNFIAYVVSDFCAKNSPKTKFVFLHIPPESKVPHFEATTILYAIIELLFRSCGDLR